MRQFILGIVFFCSAAVFGGEPVPPAERLIFITIDGLRWQEFFGGLQEELANKITGGAPNPEDLQKKFGGATPAERREKLMPFIWGTVAKKGQIFGDPEKHSLAQITNSLKFSYPGYSEMLCGFADPKVDSNKKIPNPNVTVLEWLNQKPAYKDRIYAVGSWNVIPYILNEKRSGVRVSCALPPFPQPANDRQKTINEVAATLPPNWPDCAFDAVAYQVAFEWLKTEKPKVLYVMLGETDEWAHDRRYHLYLNAARQSDDFIRRVWEFTESDPDYKGRTVLMLATDHGRGAKPVDWTSHGKNIEGAENIWIAALGPGIEPLGCRENLKVTQSQIAATLAKFLGEDYKTAEPRAAEALPLK